MCMKPTIPSPESHSPLDPCCVRKSAPEPRSHKYCTWNGPGFLLGFLCFLAPSQEEAFQVLQWGLAALRTGEIPKDLGKLTSLTVLFLHKNQLPGAQSPKGF